jgi:hypothetical protein
MHAFNLAEKKLEWSLKQVRDRRWRMVSDCLRKLMINSQYGPEACQERYVALMDGTAYIPAEMDDDPAGRFAELEERIQEYHEKCKEEARNLRFQKMEEEENHKTHKARMEDAKKAKIQQGIEKLRQEAEKAHNKAREKMGALLARQRKMNSGNEESITGTLSEIPDPRAQLTRDQLITLCKNKRISHKGKLSNEDLVSRIRDHDEHMSNRQLQSTLKQFRQPIYGSKDMLLYRLADTEKRFITGELVKRPLQDAVNVVDSSDEDHNEHIDHTEINQLLAQAQQK